MSKITSLKAMPSTPVVEKKHVATAPKLLIEDSVLVARVDEDEKEPNATGVVAPARLSLKTLLQSKSSSGSMKLKDLHTTLYCSYGVNISVNSAAAKYLQFIGGGTGLFVNSIVNSTEWASLGSIFDEFFVHEMELSYIPVNKYSANTIANQGVSAAAGQPGFVNTIGANIFGLQHNQPLYADSSSVWFVSSIATDSRWVNLGDSFKFTWKNYEKFSWSGPEGDTSTAAMTQSWLNLANVAKYGGYVSIATPEASGAAAGLGALTENGVFGHCLVRYKVSFRARS